MNLDSRSIALQGFGFGARHVALQGFVHRAAEKPETSFPPLAARREMPAERQDRDDDVLLFLL